MIRKALLFTNIILILILAIIFILLFYPYKTIEFRGDRFKVQTKVVKPGGKLTFRTCYCKYTDLPATVTRSYVNTFIYSTVPFISNLDKGCREKTVVTIVPNDLPAGKYHITNKYEYKVNPLRTVVITHESEEFEVLKGGE